MENRVFDIHSHILPGLDDGAKDMDTAIEMLRVAECEGITDLFLTPHYQPHAFTPNINLIKGTFERLQREAEKNNIQLKLYLGTEAFYYTDLVSDLEAKKVLTMNNSRYVLIEFYPDIIYSEMKRAIGRIVSSGFIPIIAHIERYICLMQSVQRVKELVDLGTLIQVNTASIIGKNGLKVRFFVYKLLRMELIHFLGTDAHSLKRRKPMMNKCVRMIKNKCNEEYEKEVLYLNVERFINSIFSI